MPEVIRFLINQIETELGEENLIKKNVLNGVLLSNLVCSQCMSSSKKYEPFIDLQIELSDSIEKSIGLFTQDELLSTEHYCLNCKNNTQAIKSLSIACPPNYLILQVKRFRQQPNPHKLSGFTRYKRRMNLRNEDKIYSYELVAVGVHIGSINSGHYIAYGKRSRN